MLKYLLIVALVWYVLDRIGLFRTRIFNHGSGRRPPGGNVNVDSASSQSSQKKRNFDGGDYVDYEEVK